MIDNDIVYYENGKGGVAISTDAGENLMIANGKTYKEIADAFGISTTTVAEQWQSIKKKLGFAIENQGFQYIEGHQEKPLLNS